MSTSGFTRYPWWRRWFGLRSERTVARTLRKLGWRILAANLNDLQGEIDLLALDGSTLVIVEVRSSETRSFGELSATVDHEKQRRLTQAALRFLKSRRLLNIPVRFDVVAVRWPADAKSPEMRHYRGAFSAVGRFQLFH